MLNKKWNNMAKVSNNEKTLYVGVPEACVNYHYTWKLFLLLWNNKQTTHIVITLVINYYWIILGVIVTSDFKRYILSYHQIIFN